MPKRFLWILFVIAPLAILALALKHARVTHEFATYDLKKRTVAGRIAMRGLRGGITPEQVEQAKEELDQERRMWLSFDGISGDINVQLTSKDGIHSSLTGRLKLEKTGTSDTNNTQKRLVYNMTINGQDNDWSVNTDGSSDNTTVTCNNSKTSDAINRINPISVFEALTFPRSMMSGLYSGETSKAPISSLSTDAFWKDWEPWLTTNVTANDYSFLDKNWSLPEVTLKNGHLYRWRIAGMWPPKGVTDIFAIYFENPKKSNDFFYPTIICLNPIPEPWPYLNNSMGYLALENAAIPTSPPDSTTGRGMLVIKLSNVSVLAGQ